jgi:5-methylcytosine-specific restriction endonuclease McrA
VINSPVLVLNKSWVPIGIDTIESAIAKLFGVYKNGEPKAKIIDAVYGFTTYTWNDWAKIEPKADENVIRTRFAAYRIPEVILLTRYDKFPDRQVPFNRRAIYNRDQYTCQYCGERPGSRELTIEHIVPKSKGGNTSWHNCVLACTSCNSKKANRTPEQANMPLIRQPFKPKFNIFNLDRKIMPKSWASFVSELYWSVELENQN